MDAWEAGWQIASEDERAVLLAPEQDGPTDEASIARAGARLAAEDAILRRLHRALVDGVVIAEGFADSGPVERAAIPPPAWLALTLDRYRGIATGEGRSWTGLRFRLGDHAEAGAPIPDAEPEVGETARALPWHEKQAIYREHMRVIGKEPRDPSARPPTQEAVYAALRSMDLSRDDVRDLQHEDWGTRARKRGPRRAK